MIRSVTFTTLAGCMALTTIAGCTSIVSGTTQQVSIVTPNAPGATCELKSPDGTYYINKTPGTVTVEKSKHDLAAICRKEGFEDGLKIIPSNFEAMTLGNVLIGGVIGLGVDAASGALNEYPDAVTIPMRALKTQIPEKTGDKDQSPPIS